MTQVPISEVVEALRLPWGARIRAELANRIEAHGIAPPDGWVLVPSEPTEAMLWAVNYFPEELIKEREAQGHSDYRARMTAAWLADCMATRSTYKAMLAAAPKPEVKP